MAKNLAWIFMTAIVAFVILPALLIANIVMALFSVGILTALTGWRRLLCLLLLIGALALLGHAIVRFFRWMQSRVPKMREAKDAESAPLIGIGPEVIEPGSLSVCDICGKQNDGAVVLLSMPNKHGHLDTTCCTACAIGRGAYCVRHGQAKVDVGNGEWQCFRCALAEAAASRDVGAGSWEFCRRRRRRRRDG